MGKIESILIDELGQTGYVYTGINDLFNQSALPLDVVEIILKWLPSVYAEHLGSGDHLVRSLIASEQPFDPGVLIELFEESSYNVTIKCSIAYVLVISRTHDISTWLMGQLLQRKSSFERSGFLDGLTKKAGIKNREELMTILKALFDKYCWFEAFLKLYRKYATAEDILFLEDKLKQPDLTIFKEYAANADGYFGGKQLKGAEKRFSKDIVKLIDAIKKRKRIYVFPEQVI